MNPRARRVPAAALAFAAAVMMGTALAGAAAAQVDLTRPTPGAAGPFTLIVREPVEGPLSQRPGPPLGPEQQRELRQARDQRAAGQPKAARDRLRPLLEAVPHQPEVATELGRSLADLEDWSALERLARAERTALRDSVILGRELASAYARQRRPRDAAAIAVEVWVASVAHEHWATDFLRRLSESEPRAVRDALRRACERRPERGDLARLTASIEQREGDLPAALRTLTTTDRLEGGARLRLSFSSLLLDQRTARDSSDAVEVLLDIAADRVVDISYRTAAARRAWDLALVRGSAVATAPRVQKALADLPPTRWSPDLRLGVARGLRQAGRTDDARALLGPGEGRGDMPEFALERALADLRDGPPGRSLPALRSIALRQPEQSYRYAEALFFAGQLDSAHAWYERAATDPNAPQTGAALERLYLLEMQAPPAARAAYGQVLYEEWRGERSRAESLADSLWRALPRGPLWAETALRLAALRAAGPEPAEALGPLLAVADSLPNDRLAPLARQRAGDLYLDRLRDESRAVAQYEECLARYPKAWNAPEVRRRLDDLRRTRRF